MYGYVGHFSLRVTVVFFRNKFFSPLPQLCLRLGLPKENKDHD